MKIYSMTATFGKLNHETLTLKPGLNVIQAPNEWGKSTWCAFLAAMLYGLDTRSHSTKTALSDKERYAPWSGAPMSGRIDLCWEGRDITIQRRTKGRTVFGDFRAYETHTGLPVPELTAQNCGEMLLGVERSVFTRSALIRLSDLPVTPTDALRRRLNSLVTTGDDSGSGEDLEQKLRDLKNRCRYNRSGLLPQAETALEEQNRKLESLNALEDQSQILRQRCKLLETEVAALENHRTALAYQNALENAQRFRQAKTQLEQAQSNCASLETQCRRLPSRPETETQLQQLRQLQKCWTQIPVETAPADAKPAHPSFQDLTPEETLTVAQKHIQSYQKNKSLLLPVLFLGLALTAAGIAAALLSADYQIFGWIAAASGCATLCLWTILVALGHNRAKKITALYGSCDTTQWLLLAQDHAAQLRSSDHAARQLHETVSALREQTRQLCGSHTLDEALSQWESIRNRWQALDAARQECSRLADLCHALQALPTDAPRPQKPDTLTLSELQTQQALSNTIRELQQLRHRLGQCQGQMESIGHRTALEAQRETLKHQIRQLEDTYAALTLALSTLATARETLQRRFAPRITSRAQGILRRLTAGRYDRLVLDADLNLQATTTEEDTLRSALWRSDGTSDLLYLALRLAVAAELTPNTPLILDDALTRFDDDRLAQTMKALTEEAAQRQIILFTCHSREAQHI